MEFIHRCHSEKCEKIPRKTSAMRPRMAKNRCSLQFFGKFFDRTPQGYWFCELFLKEENPIQIFLRPKKCLRFRLSGWVNFFYRDSAAVKIVNFSKLVNNTMEHIINKGVDS